MANIDGAVEAHSDGLAKEPTQAAGARKTAPVALRAVPAAEWNDLAARALEANPFYSSQWALACDASAKGRTGMQALAARDPQNRMIGLLPVSSAWRLWKIPLPVLASGDAYGPLGTPLLDRDEAAAAAEQLLAQARTAGAHALVLRDIPLAGKAAACFETIVAKAQRAPRLFHVHDRACLDASGDFETLLREALSAKKLKELRRQRNRLADLGDVRFTIARDDSDIGPALDVFFALEASGWKGRRGTALVQNAGDAAFIRRAVTEMSRSGACEIITLHAGETPVAAGIVLRHGDRASWFKLGVDEQFAKLSPGVQLALDLTRHLCSDPAILCGDSTANAGPHSMIDPLWRGRLAIGDMIIPLRPNSPVVPLLVGALHLRARARAFARQTLIRLRHLKEKRQ